MHVGLLLVDCWIPGSQSLKDKRRVMSGAIERLKRQFNVAACEVKFQNQWQRAQLACVMVNTDRRMLDSGLGRMLQFLERNREFEILDSNSEQIL